MGYDLPTWEDKSDRFLCIYNFNVINFFLCLGMYLPLLEEALLFEKLKSSYMYATWQDI